MLVCIFSGDSIAMQWFAQAPSNIALIKYMGKKDLENNIPSNPSLSYTLDHLTSNVLLESHVGKKDYWEPLEIPGSTPIHLSLNAQERYLTHLAWLKKQFGYRGAFIVRSSNNFPHSSGLASSASSFAALTKGAAIALAELTQTPLPSVETQAQWSRRASGSSCRSFFSPWCLWHETEVQALTLPYQNLHHEVIIISHEEKKVLSSEAHKRIQSSPEFAERPLRAQKNLTELQIALEAKDWQKAYQITWREFQDMHQLFATSQPPFSYMSQRSQEILTHLQQQWETEGDGPLVTMDAGPNIHLLYRPDQIDAANRFKQTYLVGNYDVL